MATLSTSHRHFDVVAIVAEIHNPVNRGSIFFYPVCVMHPGVQRVKFGVNSTSDVARAMLRAVFFSLGLLSRISGRFATPSA